MQTSTSILEMLGRSLRHPRWSYVNSWQHPPLLGLRAPRVPEGGVRRRAPEGVARRQPTVTAEVGRRA